MHHGGILFPPRPSWVSTPNRGTQVISFVSFSIISLVIMIQSRGSPPVEVWVTVQPAVVLLWSLLTNHLLWFFLWHLKMLLQFFAKTQLLSVPRGYVDEVGLPIITDAHYYSSTLHFHHHVHHGHEQGPKIIRMVIPVGISKMRKLAGKTNHPTLTNKSSIMTSGLILEP